MNVHESAKISSALETLGHARGTIDTADIHVFNTCCVRDTAEQKILSHIATICQKKKDNPNMIVAVVGCMTQKEGAAQKLKSKLPVDIVLGTHNINKLPDLIGKQATQIIQEREEDAVTETFKADLTSQGTIAYYINISYGCENFCSYCIVPFVRGKLIHRDRCIIEKEFDNLLGQIEPCDKKIVIYLLGQNVNSYPGFPRLLNELASKVKKHGVYLNFLSSHPKDFSEELINVIATNNAVDKNIHLPIQSGCNKILKAMNRGYTREQYLEKVSLLKARVPGVTITTDIICGFPGETEEDFRETMEFMKQVRFNAAFIFPYSRRSGTVADKMPCQLDMKTKRRRTTELINQQRQVAKGRSEESQEGNE